VSVAFIDDLDFGDLLTGGAQFRSEMLSLYNTMARFNPFVVQYRTRIPAQLVQAWVDMAREYQLWMREANTFLNADVLTSDTRDRLLGFNNQFAMLAGQIQNAAGEHVLVVGATGTPESPNPLSGFLSDLTGAGIATALAVAAIGGLILYFAFKAKNNE